MVIVITKSTNLKTYDPLRIKNTDISFYSMKDELETVPLQKCSVIVIDCGYDTDGGLAMLGDIKCTYPEIPVIFITDYDVSDIAVAAFRLGAREYLKKPVRMNELKQLINNLVRFRNISKEKRIPLTNINITDSKMRKNFNEFSSMFPENIFRSVCHIEDELLSEDSDIRNLSLDTLAQKANLSKYHYTRVFKKLSGMSPIKFVSHLKINKAKELLKKEDSSVSRVALDAGFHDISNFIKQFKKCTGLTPTAFKERSLLSEKRSQNSFFHQQEQFLPTKEQ